MKKYLLILGFWDFEGRGLWEEDRPLNSGNIEQWNFSDIQFFK